VPEADFEVRAWLCIGHLHIQTSQQLTDLIMRKIPGSRASVCGWSGISYKLSIEVRRNKNVS